MYLLFLKGKGEFLLDLYTEILSIWMYLHVQHENHGRLGFALQNSMIQIHFQECIPSMTQGHAVLVYNVITI